MRNGKLILFAKTMLFCGIAILSTALIAVSNKSTEVDYAYAEMAEPIIIDYPSKEIDVSITESESANTAKFEAYSFIPISNDIQKEIFNSCSKYEIAYELILAMIKTESEFNTDAIGDSGHAYGLMQIQPRWWDSLAAEKGLTDYRTDPAQNAELGIAILIFLLNENGGDLDNALIAYNGGADYPDKVYANYDWILEQIGERTFNN